MASPPPPPPAGAEISNELIEALAPILARLRAGDVTPTDLRAMRQRVSLLTGRVMFQDVEAQAAHAAAAAAAAMHQQLLLQQQQQQHAAQRSQQAAQSAAHASQQHAAQQHTIGMQRVELQQAAAKLKGSELTIERVEIQRDSVLGRLELERVAFCADRWAPPPEGLVSIELHETLQWWAGRLWNPRLPSLFRRLRLRCTPVSLPTQEGQAVRGRGGAAAPRTPVN